MSLQFNIATFNTFRFNTVDSNNSVLLIQFCCLQQTFSVVVGIARHFPHLHHGKLFGSCGGLSVGGSPYKADCTISISPQLLNKLSNTDQHWFKSSVAMKSYKNDRVGVYRHMESISTIAELLLPYGYG